MVVLNGRLPASELGKIPGTGILFPVGYIPQVQALRAAFEAEFKKPLSVTDGYRPYTGNYYAQVETMLRRYKPADEYKRLAGRAPVGRKSHLWNGERRYLLPGEAQVAFPGTSQHGDSANPALDLGSGVNVMDSREHRWVVANAPRFGFRWPAEWARAAGEAWHIEGVRVVAVSNTITGPGGVRIPTPGGDLPDALEKGFLMALTDAEQAELLQGIREVLPIVRSLRGVPPVTQQVWNALVGPVNGEHTPPMPFDQNIATSIAALRHAVQPALDEAERLQPIAEKVQEIGDHLPAVTGPQKGSISHG